jgi:hypothetical protein
MTSHKERIPQVAPLWRPNFIGLKQVES